MKNFLIEFKLSKYIITINFQFEIEESWVKQFKTLLKNSKKLEAVKLLKDKKIITLLEAKNFFEKLDNEWQEFGTFKTKIN